MGVPSRIDNIHKLLKQLDITEDNVFLDTEYRHNPMWTWKQTALLSVDLNASHLCIIQDDAILCNLFTEYCEYLINRWDNAIFYLICKKDVSKVIPKYSIFLPEFCTGGVATLIPKLYIESIIQEQEKDYPDYIHDDNWLLYWAHTHNIKVYCPFPSVVTTFTESILDHNGEIAFVFEKIL